MWERADQSSSRGCNGCNPLEGNQGIDCCTLKCMKTTPFAKF